MKPTDSQYAFIPPPQTPGSDTSLAGILAETFDTDALDATRVSKHLVLVVIDGLGWWNLQEYLGHAPNLRSLIRLAPHESGKKPKPTAQPDPAIQPHPHASQSTPTKLFASNTARSVFPATTAAAITSLLTGAAPGAHNMLSYQVFDPKVDQRFNLISFEGYPGKVEDFQNHPTWFEQLTARGAKTFALGPKRFIGGGLTRAALRGAEYVAVDALEERARRAALCGAQGTMTYLYMAEVDHAGHSHGVGSEPWLGAVEIIDRAVGVLLEELHADTEVLITADHGMLNTCAELTYDLATFPLADCLTQVSGEGRVLHLRVTPGQISRVQESLSEILAPYSPDTLVLTREQTMALFAQYNGVGVVRPELLGDVVIVSGGCSQVLDSRFFQPQTFAMKGIHGSLTEVEMRIPQLRYIC